MSIIDSIPPFHPTGQLAWDRFELFSFKSENNFSSLNRSRMAWVMNINRWRVASAGYSLDGACTDMAEEYFSRLRRAKIGIHHHIAGAYMLRYAPESSWREDIRTKKRQSRRTLQIPHS
jgi:hypothetical protein